MRKLHYFQRGVGDVVFVELPKIEQVFSDTKSSADQLLDYVFTVDERTGLPCGSLSQYMSDKTSDEVRKFIETTILHGAEPMANQQDVLTSNLPSDISQKFREFKGEFLVDMHRGRQESLEAYEERIGRFLRNEQNLERYRAKYSVSSNDGNKDN